MKSGSDLYLELVKTNFKLRYQGSILGFLWVLVKPLSTFLLMFVMFSKLGAGTVNMSSGQYALYLLIGIVVFNFFNEGLLWGMGSLLEKANVILKINFNRGIAVVSSISLAIINVLINIGIIFCACVFVDVKINLMSFLYIVFVFGVTILTITALSLFSSIFLVRLRDLAHISELLLQLLFYGSAVFYPIDIVPERWQFIIRFNPVAIVIQSIRDAVILGEITHVRFLSIMTVVSIVLFVIGWRFFNREVKRIAEFF